jgi:hypothetical protein
MSEKQSPINVEADLLAVHPLSVAPTPGALSDFAAVPDWCTSDESLRTQSP